MATVVSSPVEEQIVSAALATLKEAAGRLIVSTNAVRTAQLPAYQSNLRLMEPGSSAQWLKAQMDLRLARTRREHDLSTLAALIEVTTELFVEPEDEDSPAAGVTLRVPAVLEHWLCELADAVSLARQYAGEESLSERGDGPSPLDEALSSFISECVRFGVA